MRILITCVAGYGHLHPLLPIARALSDAGHDVAIATSGEIRARATAAGFTTFAAGISLDEAYARVVRSYPDEDYNRVAPDAILDWWLPHLFCEVIAPAMLDDLEPLAHSWRPDLILHETYELAGPIVAARMGVPSVSHSLGLRPSGHTLALAAAAVAPLWSRRGLLPDPEAGLYRHLCLDIMPPGLQADSPTPYPSGAIQPLRPISSPLLPGERLPEWLGKRRHAPLIYMTLGTNTNSDIAMFQSVRDGLRDLDVDVLMTLGAGRDLSALGTLPSNFHAADFVPQSLLLPRCALVICHGGAGTTLGALAEGLPLLVLPQGADQYLIAERIVAAGAGIRLAPAAVTPASVRAGVRALLGHPRYASAARRIQRQIAAMPAPAEVVAHIEMVAALSSC
jgi:UDP:flavonoid glycosyltransferase YjiC (YdhE family)